MSDGHAPLGAVDRSNQGWLVRLMRGVARGLFRVDLDQVEAEVDRGRAALSRETVAREELQRHLEKRLDEVSAVVEDVRGAYLATRSEFEQVRDGSGALQNEVESLRDRRVPHIEGDLVRMQRAIEAVQALAEELRDRRLPALAARTDALVERLHEELSVLGGLLDRLVQGEPLRVAVEPEGEAGLPAAIAAATTRFADGFRGEQAEILGRVSEYLPLLSDAAPVLELGCGRGELLEALRDAGVKAHGVDSDPAMVAACRRLGLAAEVGDALETLRARKAGSLGGVTAIHVLEHLPAATWMSVVEAAAAALRRGGVLLVECPNPDSLRVGAGLFWMDPTHRAPVHPQALAFVMRALGLEVVETKLLHPFPPEQALAKASQPEAVRELAGRLDAWLSGPRDFLVVARKP